MIKVEVLEEKELPLEYWEEFQFEGKDNTIYRVSTSNKIELLWKGAKSWEESLVSLNYLYSHILYINKLPQEPFWAEQDEKYFYITQDGKVDFDTFVNGCLSDIFKRKLGNCFKTNRITKEQINEYLNKLNNKEIL